MDNAVTGKEVSWEEFTKAWAVVKMSPLLVSVNSADWSAALDGDKDAKERIKQAINGLQLYEHAFPKIDGDVVVSLSAIDRIIDGLTVTIGFE